MTNSKTPNEEEEIQFEVEDLMKNKIYVLGLRKGKQMQKNEFEIKIKNIVERGIWKDLVEFYEELNRK
jgi:hypothetical protein